LSVPLPPRIWPRGGSVMPFSGGDCRAIIRRHVVNIVAEGAD